MPWQDYISEDEEMERADKGLAFMLQYENAAWQRTWASIRPTI